MSWDSYAGQMKQVVGCKLKNFVIHGVNDNNRMKYCSYPNDMNCDWNELKQLICAIGDRNVAFANGARFSTDKFLCVDCCDNAFKGKRKEVEAEEDKDFLYVRLLKTILLAGSVKNDQEARNNLILMIDKQADALAPSGY